jgi:very-short-patch-repair endonuclease
VCDTIISKLLLKTRLLEDEKRLVIESTNSITPEGTKTRTFNKRCACFVLGIQEDKVCKICSSPIPFVDFKTYIKQIYCCRECRIKDVAHININANKALTGNKDVVLRREKTLQERYGIKNAMHSNTIKQERKERSLIKYGVSSPLHTETSKEKRRQTCLERYGYSNHLTKLQQDRQPKINIKYDSLLCLSNITPCFKREEYVGIINNENGSTINYPFACKKCHQQFYKHLASWSRIDTCPYCDEAENTYEDIIETFLKKHHIDFTKHDRHLLKGREIDFLIPDKKICIEIDGLYYHSSKFITDKKYHLDKTIKCEEAGFKLIHIFGDEILNTKALHTRLRSILNLNKIKINARDCYVSNITQQQKTLFLNKYHLQGDCIGSSINLGLFYKGRLISVMCFGLCRASLGSTSKEGQYELYRFCCMNNITIRGGANKLFKHFIRNNNFHEIVSFCDLRYSSVTSNFYTKLGFKLSHVSQPNYWIVAGNKRYHRYGYRKSVLNKKLKTFNPELTERENLHNNRLYVIYDCGNIRYVYNS